MGAAHWRPLARHAGTVRQLEFCVRALLALEQARSVDAAFETLASLGPPADEEHAIDSTNVRAHQHAAGVKRGNQNQEALGRSRGGFSTKVHRRTNAKGDPLTFDVTPGEAHEVKGYDALMELHDVDPDRLLGDKGYDSDGIRDDLTDRGIEPVIPPRSNRKTPINYDREAYKRRNLIERCQPPQTIPSHRHSLRENRQGLSVDAMYRFNNALAENCQHGLVPVQTPNLQGDSTNFVLLSCSPQLVPVNKAST